MRHDDYPDVVIASPCLHLRQHGLYGLRFGVVASRFHFHEEVRVDNEIFQGSGTVRHFRSGDDVGGSGGYLVQVEVHHVAVEETDDGLQLLPGVAGGIYFAQHQLDEMGDVLILVRHFE